MNGGAAALSAMLASMLGGCHDWEAYRYRETADAGSGGASDAGVADGSLILFQEDFESSTLTGAWSEGTTHGAWTVVYSGFGSVGIESDGTHVLSESPQPSTSAGETHAALVVSTMSFGDLDLSIRVRTVSQLRADAPNPWEVGWVLWHFVDPTHFYALVLKPTGWDLTKEDAAYPGNQRFMAGGGQGFTVGTWHTVHVRQIGSTMTVSADGTDLTTFNDGERPYLQGTLGLYSEDAHAHFDDVVVKVP